MLDRRSVFALAAGSLATTVATGASKALRNVPLDPARPEDASQIHRKLRLRTDSGLVFWWIRGPSFGQVGADLTPLYVLNYGLVQRVTQRADGGCDVRQLELAFRTDLETGQPLKTLRNPYTGESLPIGFNPVGPADVRFSRENVPEVPAELGGSKLTFEAIPSRPFVIGDTVYYQLRNRSVVTTPGAADRVINDISMLTGPAAQALDPHTTWVDAKLQSTDVTGWPRWMRMGDRPGGVTLRRDRRQGAPLRRPAARFPQDAAGRATRHRRDPVAALDGPEAVYRNERATAVAVRTSARTRSATSRASDCASEKIAPIDIAQMVVQERERVTRDPARIAGIDRCRRRATDGREIRPPEVVVAAQHEFAFSGASICRYRRASDGVIRRSRVAPCSITGACWPHRPFGLKIRRSVRRQRDDRPNARIEPFATSTAYPERDIAAERMSDGANAGAVDAASQYLPGFTDAIPTPAERVEQSNEVGPPILELLGVPCFRVRELGLLAPHGAAAAG